MTVCERCWDDAFLRSRATPESQAEAYEYLVAVRHLDPVERRKCARATRVAQDHRRAAPHAENRSFAIETSGDIGIERTCLPFKLEECQAMTDLGYEEDDFEDEEANCQTCCGDGWETCTDPLCFEPDHHDGWHTCPNCRGTGLAKDQWYS